jgi:hypothetical protein
VRYERRRRAVHDQADPWLGAPRQCARAAPVLVHGQRVGVHDRARLFRRPVPARPVADDHGDRGGRRGRRGVHGRSLRTGTEARRAAARPEPCPVRLLRRAAAERGDLAAVPELTGRRGSHGRRNAGRALAHQPRPGGDGRVLRRLADGCPRLPDPARRHQSDSRGRADHGRCAAGPPGAAPRRRPGRPDLVRRIDLAVVLLDHGRGSGRVGAIRRRLLAVPAVGHQFQAGVLAYLPGQRGRSGDLRQPAPGQEGPEVPAALAWVRWPARSCCAPPGPA